MFGFFENNSLVINLIFKKQLVLLYNVNYAHLKAHDSPCTDLAKGRACMPLPPKPKSPFPYESNENSSL